MCKLIQCTIDVERWIHDNWKLFQWKANAKSAKCIRNVYLLLRVSSQPSVVSKNSPINESKRTFHWNGENCIINLWRSWNLSPILSIFLIAALGIEQLNRTNRHSSSSFMHFDQDCAKNTFLFFFPHIYFILLENGKKEIALENSKFDIRLIVLNGERLTCQKVIF